VFLPDSLHPRRWSFTYEIPRHSYVRLGRLVPAVDVSSLVFSIGRDIYVLRVPHDLNAHDVSLDRSTVLLQDEDTILNIQGLRYCSASLALHSMYSTSLEIRIHTSCSVGNQAGHARLGSGDCLRNDSHSSLTLNLPYEAELFDVIEFDEWAGVVVVVTSSFVGGEFDQDYATIFTVDSLGDYVLNSLCP
jgi:hypothetical protein